MLELVLNPFLPSLDHIADPSNVQFGAISLLDSTLKQFLCVLLLRYPEGDEVLDAEELT